MERMVAYLWLFFRTCFISMSKGGNFLIGMNIGDFDGFVYDDGINMDWYSPLIYDIYFDGNYIDNDIINNDNNGSDDIINVVIFK